ncbi:hypothetical protein ACS0TY_028235 [Phlomoides rotata]
METISHKTVSHSYSLPIPVPSPFKFKILFSSSFFSSLLFSLILNFISTLSICSRASTKLQCRKRCAREWFSTKALPLTAAFGRERVSREEEAQGAAHRVGGNRSGAVTIGHRRWIRPCSGRRRVRESLLCARVLFRLLCRLQTTAIFAQTRVISALHR